jgi:translocation and assembly module TamB
MTHSALSEEPNFRPPQRGPRWGKLVFMLGVVAIAGIAGGAWWGWIFIHEKLAPLVADGLSRDLDRPVQLGKLERVSWNSMRFGSSALPATPTDPDWATVEAVEVQFNPWLVLWQRQLQLGITLIKPEAFLEQDSQGLWVNTTVKSRPEKGPIEVQVSQFRLQDAQVELLAQPKPKGKRQSVRLQKISGFVDLLDKNRRFSYYLRGDSSAKGTFRIRGESTRLGKDSAGKERVISKLNAEGDNFLLGEIDRLIRLPVTVTAGRIKGKVDIILNPDLTFNLRGRAKLKQVNLIAPGAPKPINQANGDIELEDTTVVLKKVTGQFDRLPFVAQGRIDPKQGFDLNVNLDRVGIPLFLQTFAIKTPVPITGEVKAAVKLSGPLAKPVISGQVANRTDVNVDRLAIKTATGEFRLDSATEKLQLRNLIALPALGGRITGQGTIGVTAPQPVNLALTVENAPGDAIAQLYSAQKPPFQIGPVNAAINVTGPASNAITTANWQAPQSTYQANGTVVIRENGQRIELQRLNAKAYGGTIVATGELVKQIWRANMQINGVQLAQADRQLQGSLNGQVKVQGRLDDLSLAGTTADATLIAQTYGGTINTVAQLRNQNWQADVNLAGIQLAQANAQLRGAADGSIRLRGRSNDLAIAKTFADGQIRLSQGIAVVNQPIDANFNWDGRKINLQSATGPGIDARGVIYANVSGTPAVTGLDLQVKTSGIALATLPIAVPDPVKLAGTADFTGRVSGSPTKPDLVGNLALLGFGLNGIGFEPLQGPIALTAQRGLSLDLKGDRDRLALNLDTRNQPIAVNVQRGALNITGQSQGELFNVNLAAIPLNELSGLGIKLPNLSGNLSGQASINLARAELAMGVFDIAQVRVGQAPFAFESPQVRATVSYVNGIGKGNINLSQPRLGAITSNDANTNFIYANNQLRVSEFSITKENAATEDMPKTTSRYTIAGNLDLRTTQPKVTGVLKINQGQIQDILAAAQIFELNDLARGTLLPTYGTIADIGTQSIGASNESNVPLKTQLEQLAETNSNIRKIAQDRRNLVKRIPGQVQTTTLLPELADIQGLFDSEVNFNASAAGIDIDKFQLAATKVKWRPYRGYTELQTAGGQTKISKRDSRVLEIHKFTVDASYQKGLLNLTRANAQIGNAQVNLQLSYGGETTSGQLKIDQLPIKEIQKFYPLPPNLLLAGELTGITNFGGTRQSPNANGNLFLLQGGVNGNPIDSAKAFYTYDQGRLNIGTTVRIEAEGEPLSIEGEIPLPLPMINFWPKDNTIAVNVNVKNQGLAFLNLFNLPIVWDNGEGSVNLAIGGELFNPTASGEILLNNASFKMASLPEPLTNVNGQIRFDRDIVRVESLQGNFSKGNIAAKGVIPLTKVTANLPIPEGMDTQACLSEDANQPLNLSLNGITLFYKGLYKGAVRGCVNVAGNLFTPKVTGEITLFNGQVLLADQAPTAAIAANVTDSEGPPESAGLEFDNLRLTLGDNIQIIKAPFLNFVAKGTLDVNGNLNNPQPTGKIFLRSGQVNIFTTQFVLARGHTNTATFKAEQGLDPDLDIRLISRVSEVKRSPIVTQAFESEVNDSPLFATNLGSIETIRIQASINGAASQLFDKLELTSSPDRSKNEIIGLLGGGFVNTLGRGDSTLGIANLAGSALLTNVQGFVGNALGLSDFRLFPTISRDETKRSSTLGLAAELGVDITPSISVSVLKILTSKESPQLGLNYRINENFLFRGSTDFFGDNRAIVEFQTRF